MKRKRVIELGDKFSFSPSELGDMMITILQLLQDDRDFLVQDDRDFIVEDDRGGSGGWIIRVIR
jgi:hypothetical protein